MRIQRFHTLIALGMIVPLIWNLNFYHLISDLINNTFYEKDYEETLVPGIDSFSNILSSREITQRDTHEESQNLLYMPLVSLDRQNPDIRSPFSIQIAALHQVLPQALDNQTQFNDLQSAKNSPREMDVGTLSPLVSALKNTGADWTRVRVEWEVIEPNAPIEELSPAYAWEYYDQTLELVAGTGVRIIATITDSPNWAASVPCAPIYPDRLDEFRRFLTDLVNRYKNAPYYIKHWELVNEPDSNRYASGHLSGHGCWAYNGDQYARMLVIANQAIKQADQKATVLMGGLAYDWFEEYGGPFYRYFPDDVMASGGGSQIDAFNLHYFRDFSAEWDRWNPNSFDQRYDWIPPPTCGIVDDGIGTEYSVNGFDVVAKTTHFRNRMDTCYSVSKPIWLTEVSDHGYPDDMDSLISQARYLIKVYARALSDGVRNITWFSLDQPSYDPNAQALLYPDFSPKPAFFAYKTLTTEMDGYYSYSHNRNHCVWGSSGPVCYVEAYIFNDDYMNEKTIAWGRRNLSFSSSGLRVVDRNGVVSFIKDGSKEDLDRRINGTITLKLTDEPLFISSW